MTIDLLPSSVPREIRGRVAHKGAMWIPLFCMNCGVAGPHVPEQAVQDKAYHGYLCEPCGEKWSPLFDTMLVPDEVFWARVKQEQLEREGRELQPYEVVEALKDGNHYLSKLARDRFALQPGSSITEST